MLPRAARDHHVKLPGNKPEAQQHPVSLGTQNQALSKAGI